MAELHFWSNYWTLLECAFSLSGVSCAVNVLGHLDELQMNYDEKAFYSFYFYAGDTVLLVSLAKLIRI